MTSKLSIASLPDEVGALSSVDRELFDRLFRVTVSEGGLRMPEGMRAWARRRFGDPENVERQAVIRVANRWTLEETVFNPLRGSRPKQARTQAPSPAGDDPLDRPLEMTPEDTFGRIEGEHCLTAANIAKAEGWHGLIVFREPDPLAFSRESVRECLGVARRWWRAAHDADPAAVYPLLFWNCGAAAGASLPHAHAQLVLARDRHFGGIERLRAAAETYGARHGSNYWQDLTRAHDSLGLAFSRKGAAVMASLTPVKERGIDIVAPSAEEGLAEALYGALSCYRGRLAVRWFNLAMVAPPLAETEENWRGFPWLARLVERSGAQGAASDVGSMEMYAAAVVSSDPFDVAAALAEELTEPR